MCFFNISSIFVKWKMLNWEWEDPKFYHLGLCDCEGVHCPLQANGQLPYIENKGMGYIVMKRILRSKTIVFIYPYILDKKDREYFDLSSSIPPSESLTFSWEKRKKTNPFSLELCCGSSATFTLFLLTLAREEHPIILSCSTTSLSFPQVVHRANFLNWWKLESIFPWQSL